MSGKQMTAAQWAQLGPCDRLAIVDLALHQLAAGEKRAEVRHGDYWVRYSLGSVPYLERERARLNTLCNKGSRRAITIQFGRP